MKTEVQKCITEPKNIEIKGITLLSKCEFYDYEENIANINCNWWLRSASFYDTKVYVVDGRKNEPNLSYLVDNPNIYVRPALRINFNIYDFAIGNKFKFADKTWTIISHTLAICDNHIGEHYFRNNLAAEDANVYDSSDIKEYIEQWLNDKNIKKYKITIEECIKKTHTAEIEATSQEEAMEIAMEKYAKDFKYTKPNNIEYRQITVYDPQTNTIIDKKF